MSSHRVWQSIVPMILALAGVALAVDKDGFVDTFNVKPSDFASSGRNDYFILEPGYQQVLEGSEEGKSTRLVITVLDETKTIDGVETRIIEENESAEGKPVEISRNYFAIDKTTNDVYYFGEDVDVYKDGKVASHPGSWLSGQNGAHYGLFMPAKPEVGQKFYQELAPGVAMDRFEVVSVSEKVKVPAGKFKNCLKTKETTPVEPDTTEYKLYAPGVGLLVDGDLKLVKYGQKKNEKADSGAKPAATRASADEPLVPIETVSREEEGSSFLPPSLRSLLHQAVADSRLGQQVLRPRRVDLQLLAKLVHVNA